MIALPGLRQMLALAAACSLVTDMAIAQDPQAADLSNLGNRFARATITEHGDERRFPQGWYFAPDGNLTVQGTPLIALIGRAYGVREFQIVDGPDWIRAEDLYDIEAVPPPAELIESDSTQMLRALLSDRFKLEISATSRDMAVTALEFVKETPAFQQAHAPTLRLAPGQTEGMYMPRRVVPPSGESVIFQMELTLPALARQLSGELRQNVVDATGLEGIWTVELEQEVVRGRAVPFSLTSVLERLGLRIIERTMPVDAIAIDHVEHPQLDD